MPYAEGGTKRTRFCVVNTQDGLTEMVEAIVSQDKVALYVAVEASLLVLHVHPQLDCSYVVDLQSLGTTAFESCEASRAREGIKALDAGKTLSPAQVAAAKAEVEETSGEPRIRSCGKWQQGSPLPSLKAVLEGKSPSVPKVLFDCSQACAFLACQFGVRMGSVQDLQCLELEGRSTREKERREWGDGMNLLRLRDLRSCLE